MKKAAPLLAVLLFGTLSLIPFALSDEPEDGLPLLAQVANAVPYGFVSFQVVANAAGPLPAPTGGAAGFDGFPVPEPPGAQQQVGPGVWVLHTGNRTGQHTHFADFLARSIRSGLAEVVPDGYEIRFTAEGSYGYDGFAIQDGDVLPVPFELWNIGRTPDDPADDYRMIPYIVDWDNDGWNLQHFDHTVSPGTDDPETDWIFFMRPLDQSPGEAGYRAWEQKALALPLGRNGHPSDGGTGSFVDVEVSREVMGRIVFVNLDGGDVTTRQYNQTMPEEGTIFRILSSPFLLGDASGNFTITGADASLTLRHWTGVAPLDETVAAEVSGNDAVTPYDGALILQHLDGLLPCFATDPTCEPREASPPTATLQWGFIEETAAGGFELPLQMSAVSGAVYALQFDIRLDSREIEVGRVLATLPPLWEMGYRLAGDTLRIGMLGRSPLQAGEVARLALTPRSPTASIRLLAQGTVHDNPVQRLPPFATGVAVERRDEIPDRFGLAQNYPNPFNPGTRIEYQVPQAARVVLDVYDVQGRHVARLVDAQQPAGTYTVTWDARSDAGRPLPSGVYLYKFQAGDFFQTKEMLLLK